MGTNQISRGPTPNTILLTVKITLFWCSFRAKKMLFSNHNTKFHTKIYFLILYVFNFLCIIYLIVHFINKIRYLGVSKVFLVLYVWFNFALTSFGYLRSQISDKICNFNWIFYLICKTKYFFFKLKFSKTIIFHYKKY